MDIFSSADRNSKSKQNARGGVARADDDKEEEQPDIEVQHSESLDVTRLPPPEPLPCDESGTPISVRIPPALPRENTPFIINCVRKK